MDGTSNAGKGLKGHLFCGILRSWCRQRLPKWPGWQQDPTACGFANDCSRPLGRNGCGQKADERCPQFVVLLRTQAEPEFIRHIWVQNLSRQPVLCSGDGSADGHEAACENE